MHGFTLIELMLALMLMAGIASILYGSLSLAARSWDGGEANAERVSDMRADASLPARPAFRAVSAADVEDARAPLMFAGEREELRYAAVLPERVAGGGVYYFRLAVVRTGEKSQLVQERIVPDVGSLQAPEFRDAERSVLADDIAEFRIGYFGRDANAADVDTPTWRDRWEDRQRLPLLVRLDVKPVKGAAWPTLVVEPRRSPEAGCPCTGTRARAAARGEGDEISASPRDARAARHRAHHGAVAHGADRRDRQQLRLQHARRGAGRPQHDVARAGARGGRRGSRAHGVRAVAAARFARRHGPRMASRTPGPTTTSR